MKKVWLVLIVGIFLVGVVSAASFAGPSFLDDNLGPEVCTNDNTIMRLYRENNPHGSSCFQLFNVYTFWWLILSV